MNSSTGRTVSFKESYSKAIAGLRAELRVFLKLTDSENKQLEIDLTLGSDTSSLAKAMWNLLICLDDKDASLDTAAPNYQYIKSFDYSDAKLKTPFLISFLKLLVLIRNNPEKFINDLEVNNEAAVKATKVIVGIKNLLSKRTLNDEIIDRCDKRIKTVLIAKMTSFNESLAMMSSELYDALSSTLNTIELLSKEGHDASKSIRNSISNFNETIQKHFNHSPAQNDAAAIDEIQRIKATLTREYSETQTLLDLSKALPDIDKVKFKLSVDTQDAKGKTERSVQEVSHSVLMSKINENQNKLMHLLDNLTSAATKQAEFEAKQAKLKQEAEFAKKQQEEAKQAKLKQETESSNLPSSSSALSTVRTKPTTRSWGVKKQPELTFEEVKKKYLNKELLTVDLSKLLEQKKLSIEQTQDILNAKIDQDKISNSTLSFSGLSSFIEVPIVDEISTADNPPKELTENSKGKTTLTKDENPQSGKNKNPIATTVDGIIAEDADSEDESDKVKEKTTTPPQLEAPQAPQVPQAELTIWQNHGGRIVAGITFGLLVAGIVVLNVLFPLSILANAGLVYAAFTIAVAAGVTADKKINPNCEDAAPKVMTTPESAKKGGSTLTSHKAMGNTKISTNLIIEKDEHSASATTSSAYSTQKGRPAMPAPGATTI